MPRPWTLTVEPYPPLTGEPHPVRIMDIRKDARSTITVILEHTTQEQAGRSHNVTLPIPLRPGTLTAGLFQACGFETDPGTTIEPKKVLGREILAKFAAVSDSGEYIATEFQAIEQEE
jgi:hypothetical protein